MKCKKEHTASGSGTVGENAGDLQGICGFYNIFQSINPSFSNVNFPVLRLITSIPLAASVVEISFLPKYGVIHHYALYW